MIQISGPSSFKSTNIPLDPGVYLFRDAESNLLYIGKAKHLRSRIRSYFNSSKKWYSVQFSWALILSSEKHFAISVI